MCELLRWSFVWKGQNYFQQNAESAVQAAFLCTADLQSLVVQGVNSQNVPLTCDLYWEFLSLDTG